MTKPEKELAWLLLQKGHYMVKSTNSKGKEIFKVMKGRQIPVQYFSRAVARKFTDLFKIDSKKKITLNLSAVRQLNGNTYIKKLYKKEIAGQ